MNVLTILGTRPEIIRLSRIIPLLDRYVNHKILHTGQNYDANLNDIFFSQLGVRQCDFIIDSKSNSLSEQLGKIFVGVENAINSFKPDKVLILGDTNSSLAAIVCERLGVPVYHMEAGNRCYDLKVPEEKNRKIIDTISSINMPYTETSRQNLLREGIANDKIFVVGNPINEVIEYYRDQIDSSNILNELNLEKAQYVIVTAHRSENVDVDQRLKNIFSALEVISKDNKVVFSCHPRTKNRMEKLNLQSKNIIVSEPFGFFDFINLEKNSKMAISDSGTVQEEMCIFNIPTITIRDSTERPETVWCGSNIISGLNVDSILRCYNFIIDNKPNNWNVPEEYIKKNVSQTVLNILLSNHIN
jgi:UDP-N-acetylglucosamine 2-epimerase (non-hydrolysing)